MAETPSELQAEIEQLERKHAENPDGRYFVPLANDYRKLGELDRAESLLRAGIGKHPDYLSARIVLGRCLTDRGDSAGAVKEFEHVLSMDPQNLIALRSLAELALADGRKRDARRWYEELLAVDPMNADARQALEAMGPPEEPGEGSWWEPSSAVEAGGAPAARAGGAEIEIIEAEQSSDVVVELSEIDLDATPEAPDTEAADEAAFDLPEAAAPHETMAPAAPGAAVDDYDPDQSRIDELDDWDLPEEVESVEVVTETIAELYARQGLTDRAAEVYRELIRRRGGAPELEQRLRELEAAAAAERLQELDLEAVPGIPADDDEAEESGLADISELGVLEPGAEGGDDTPQETSYSAPVAEAADAWELPEDRTDSETLDFAAADHGDADEPEGGHPEPDLEPIESWAPDDSFEISMDAFPAGDPDAETSHRDDSDRDDPFAASFAFGFPEEAAGRSDDLAGGSREVPSPGGDDDLVPVSMDFESDEPVEAAPVPADSDAPDWGTVSSAWGPDSQDRDRAGDAAPMAGMTIVDYLGALARWSPGAQHAGVATEPVPPEAVSAEAPPSESPMPETVTPAAAAEPSATDEPATEELGAWESIEEEQGMPQPVDLPAAPNAEREGDAGAGTEEELESISAFGTEIEELPESETEPVIGLDDYFSDDERAAAPSSDSVSASSEAEPEPEGADEDDEDLESFQAWLRSLKR